MDRATRTIVNQNFGRVEDIDVSSLFRGDYEAKSADSSLDSPGSNVGYNVLYQQSPVHEPVVDERYLANGGRKPTWPDDADFAVCLTHDVDQVTNYSVRQNIRETARLVGLRETTVGKAKVLLKQATRFPKILYHARQEQDPYHAFERWLDVEKRIGAKSTFFFMPEVVNEPHRTDPNYTFSDTIVFDGEERTVAEMMREIDSQGWEVGLHPTWHTYDDPHELARQKAQVEGVLGHEVRSVRQHFLHYDIERTPRAHTEAGFRFDSTLGFTDGVGFRFGTSYPWQLYDGENNERLPILELPLVIQDGALLNSRKGLSLDKDTAFAYLRQLVDRVENVGGVLTLNWHPRFVGEDPWWSLYERVLRHLETKDAWVASVDEIGNWWLRNGFNRIQ